MEKLDMFHEHLIRLDLRIKARSIHLLPLEKANVNCAFGQQTVVHFVTETTLGRRGRRPLPTRYNRCASIDGYVAVTVTTLDRRGRRSLQEEKITDRNVAVTDVA